MKLAWPLKSKSVVSVAEPEDEVDIEALERDEAGLGETLDVLGEVDDEEPPEGIHSTAPSPPGVEGE